MVEAEVSSVLALFGLALEEGECFRAKYAVNNGV